MEGWGARQAFPTSHERSTGGEHQSARYDGMAQNERGHGDGGRGGRGRRDFQQGGYQQQSYQGAQTGMGAYQQQGWQGEQEGSAHVNPHFQDRRSGYYHRFAQYANSDNRGHNGQRDGYRKPYHQRNPHYNRQQDGSRQSYPNQQGYQHGQQRQLIQYSQCFNPQAQAQSHHDHHQQNSWKQQTGQPSYEGQQFNNGPQSNRQEMNFNYNPQSSQSNFQQPAHSNPQQQYRPGRGYTYFKDRQKRHWQNYRNNWDGMHNQQYGKKKWTVHNDEAVDDDSKEMKMEFMDSAASRDLTERAGLFRFEHHTAKDFEPDFDDPEDPQISSPVRGNISSPEANMLSHFNGAIPTTTMPPTPTPQMTTKTAQIPSPIQPGLAFNPSSPALSTQSLPSNSSLQEDKLRLILLRSMNKGGEVMERKIAALEETIAEKERILQRAGMGQRADTVDNYAGEQGSAVYDDDGVVGSNGYAERTDGGPSEDTASLSPLSSAPISPKEATAPANSPYSTIEGEEEPAVTSASTKTAITAMATAVQTPQHSGPETNENSTLAKRLEESRKKGIANAQSTIRNSHAHAEQDAPSPIKQDVEMKEAAISAPSMPTHFSASNSPIATQPATPKPVPSPIIGAKRSAEDDLSPNAKRRSATTTPKTPVARRRACSPMYLSPPRRPRSPTPPDSPPRGPPSPRLWDRPENFKHAPPGDYGFGTTSNGGNSGRPDSRDTNTDLIDSYIPPTSRLYHTRTSHSLVRNPRLPERPQTTNSNSAREDRARPGDERMIMRAHALRTDRNWRDQGVREGSAGLVYYRRDLRDPRDGWEEEEGTVTMDREEYEGWRRSGVRRM